MALHAGAAGTVEGAVSSGGASRAAWRLLYGAVALLMGLLAVGLYTRAGWATWLWPFSDGRMTYVFLASIAAAVAAPMLWIAIVDEPAAIAGIAADGVAVGVGLTAALLAMGLARDDRHLLVYAAGATLPTLVALAVFRATHRLPMRDRTPQPRLARIAFVVFIAFLLWVGGWMVAGNDEVFPWSLPSGTRRLTGALFLGAATYFVYGLWRKSWVHTGGQLAGFLAYDAVLIGPYLRAFLDRNDGSTVPQYGSYDSSGGSDEVAALNLAVYIGVLVVSAAIAVYYLSLDSRTRLWRRLDASPLEDSAPDGP